MTELATADLRVKALDVVVAAAHQQPIRPGHSTARVAACRDVRAATGCALVDAIAAVDWAIEQVTATSLHRFRQTTETGWLYRFPNGRDASIINDPHRPFRFEMLSDSLDAPGGTVAGLTSEQVEAHLYAIAGRSAANDTDERN
ncbi:hypothetical protein [Verrucosispora sp. WMMC514]|uniref:hypothetical protein n=1 Tax=Verrucosispora sp. WMMC514 TaxID=3015156 RepID=UPI00248C6DE2|nr:hypothetical protein [Verrucosispora sp. WMMC514]WBB94143.1 hypothetical protein O7597_14940 [Verrucosispora sp. WMMC514]